MENYYLGSNLASDVINLHYLYPYLNKYAVDFTKSQDERIMVEYLDYYGIHRYGLCDLSVLYWEGITLVLLVKHNKRIIGLFNILVKKPEWGILGEK
jgi:hypothetical protein